MTGTRGGTSSGTSAGTSRARDREILRLAVPAFLALVAEPLFLLSDAAIVGHLGTPQLAGLGIAGAVLQTVVGLCVFLAYGTTASVARRLGAGDVRGALEQGVDGVWLAVLIGTVATLAGVPLAGWLVGLFGPGPEVAGPATTYLRLALLGVVPLLVVLAATGILRGLQDTRTPLVVAVAGNLANIALNVLLVYGLDLGIAGSAIGTVLAQLGSAPRWWRSWSAPPAGRARPLRPDLAGVRRAAHAGVALVVRTLTLRASLLVMTYGAATLGATSVATHQLASTVWTFLAFALDAVAIAAQALTGRTLGAGDARRDPSGHRPDGALGAGQRRRHRRRAGAHRPAARWAVHRRPAGPRPAVAGAAGGRRLPAGGRRGLRPRRRADRRRRRPLPGVGRRRGARGVRAAGLAGAAAGRRGPLPGPALVWLWVAFGIGFMGSRAVVLLSRARGSRWMVTGVEPRRVTG